MTEDQVRAKLRQEGYSDVSSITREGNKFEAKATKDGKQVELEIDSSGMVTTK